MIKQNIEQLSMELNDCVQQVKTVTQSLNNISNDLQKIKKDSVDLQIISKDQCRQLINLVNIHVVQLLGGKDSKQYKSKLRSKAFLYLYKRIHSEIGVDDIKEIPVKYYSKAIEIVCNYQIPLVLQEKINSI